MGKAAFITASLIVFVAIIWIGLSLRNSAIEQQLAAAKERAESASPTGLAPSPEPPPPPEPASPRDSVSTSQPAPTPGVNDSPEAAAIAEDIQQAGEMAKINEESIQAVPPPETPSTAAPASPDTSSSDTAATPSSGGTDIQTLTVQETNVVLDKMADGTEQVTGTVQGQIAEAVNAAVANVPGGKSSTPADPDALPTGDTAAANSPQVQQAIQQTAAEAAAAGKQAADGAANVVQDAVDIAKEAAAGKVTAAADALPTGDLPAAAATASEFAAPPVDPSTLPPKVVVLAYHQFMKGDTWGKDQHTTPAGVFEKHMAMLKAKGFQVIPVESIVNALNGNGQLPPRAAAITIDNGFQNSAKYAGPILKKYDYPWTFFVFTNLVSAGGSGASWAQLRTMYKDDYVSVQSQTASHKFLTRGLGQTGQAYKDWLVSELTKSKLQIQREVGNVVNLLAFPYGNYDAEVQEQAAASGYTGMFTVEGNPVTTQTKSNAIGRFVVTQFTSDIFETYLDQPTLLMMDASPAPGSVTAEVRPSITTVLAYAGSLDPGSFTAEIFGHPKPQVAYDPATGRVTVTPADDLKERCVRVKIKAIDTGTGKPVALAWYFFFEGALRDGE